MADYTPPQQGNPQVDNFLIQAFRKYRQELPGYGYGVFGYDFANEVATDPNIRQQYYPSSGEDYQSWINRLESKFKGMSQVIGGGRLPGNDGKLTGPASAPMDSKLVDSFKSAAKFYDESKAGEPAPKTPEELRQEAADARQADQDKQNADTQAKMKAFYDQMQKPLDMNDPQVKQVLADASNQAGQQAAAQGVQGGMATQNSELMADKAAFGLQQQRQQMGLQALGMAGGQGLGMSGVQLGQGQLGLGQQQFGADQYWNQYNAQNAQNLMNWQSQGNAARTLGGIGGAAIGAAGGFLAGGPGGAAAGLSTGYGLGSGLGGMANGGPPAYRGPGYHGGGGA